MMNAKLSKQRFWHCHENGLIKTIQTIPHNLYVSFKLTSLYCGLRIILVYPKLLFPALIQIRAIFEAPPRTLLPELKRKCKHKLQFVSNHRRFEMKSWSGIYEFNMYQSVSQFIRIHKLVFQRLQHLLWITELLVQPLRALGEVSKGR